MSEDGAAVVLTLVDAGFQAPGLRPRPEGNASAGQPPTEEELSADGLVRIAKLLEAELSGVNETEDVVVVRAERKNGREEVDEELLEKAEREPEPRVPALGADLNDGAARARLAGSGDESVAAILDGLVTAGPSEPHEEIPSFNEWAQKRLEEAEKKKAQPNASVQTANGSPDRSLGNMRMRSKNYASPDCGAKIVAANPESRSARSVLVSTRDEYMLNTCTTRVWFVVELCEAIQAKKIELANFELFSSSPKDLSVYVSDRFPTRDWSNVGQFTARDERDVQSFSLKPHLFGKFIKVELHSHYGSEHFCPISLFRAYGTSEFEVLETETETDMHIDSRRRGSSIRGDAAAGSGMESDDDDEEESVFEDEEESTSSDPPGNLFGSARDAVLSIVKKAAEVLIKSDDLKSSNNITKIQESISGDVLEDTTLDECITPMYNVACRDCTDDQFAKVFQLISCRGQYLESLLNTVFVQSTLVNGHLCENSSGFNFFHDRLTSEEESITSNYYLKAQLLSSFLGSDYIIALCNVLAVHEQRLFVNTSNDEQQIADKSPNETLTEQSSQILLTAKDERVASFQTTDATIKNPDNIETKAESPVIKSKLEPVIDCSQNNENPSIQPTKIIAPNEDMKRPSVAANLELNKNRQLNDINSQQIEPLLTTESVPTVDKKISIPSPKVISASASNDQASISESQKPANKLDVPASKIENSQRSNEHIGSMETDETRYKSEEEFEIKAKMESAEQDPKLAMQYQLNFGNLDFDVENLQSNEGIKNDASGIQNTANVLPQQKESVFLRLSNRIKALERNMSLSSQYLEELSRRYKKQVEEMQRILERAMTTMSEESRKGDERESKRNDEVASLRSQIVSLTKVLDDLIYERNSWRINFSSFIQHGFFIFINVIVVLLVLSYCRRADDEFEFYEENENVKSVMVKPKRGKNYEIAKQHCSQLSKKSKKRRPSEIASQVSGTYEQLMIRDTIAANQLSKRDRRKKRKRDAIIRSLSTKETSNYKDEVSSLQVCMPLPSRSASANDALNYNNMINDFTNFASQNQSRPKSAPNNSTLYFNDNQSETQQSYYDRKVQVLTIEPKHNNSITNHNDSQNSSDELNMSIPLDDDAFEQKESSTTSSILAKAKKISSPAFMKTALGSRSKRISFSGNNTKKLFQSFDESIMQSSEIDQNEKISPFSELERRVGGGDDINIQSTNGHIEESDGSRSSSTTLTSNWNKKEKKTHSLKKMVRKFF